MSREKRVLPNNMVHNMCVPKNKGYVCPPICAPLACANCWRASFWGDLLGHHFGRPFGSNPWAANLETLTNLAALGDLATVVARPTLGALLALGHWTNMVTWAFLPSLATLAFLAAVTALATMTRLAAPRELRGLDCLAPLHALATL